MEEKILIKSERYNVKKLFMVIVIVGIVISMLMMGYYACEEIGELAEMYDYSIEKDHDLNDWYTIQGKWYHKFGGCICTRCRYGTKFNYVIRNFNYVFRKIEIDNSIIIAILPTIFAVLLGGLIYFWLRSYELTVTNKRIYGKVAWGKRVDLPVDSVSATATINLLKGVSVSTASGRISFLVIKNAEEIYNVIGGLLIDRQQEKSVLVEKAPIADNADELKKFKSLLDEGVITQEEFDAKKKKILGL